MRKRGPIIGLAGVFLFTASFLVVISVYPANPTLASPTVMPKILDDMFDEVTPEVQIFAGQTKTFSYTPSQSNVPLLWGVQVLDYQSGDQFSVSIRNVFGETFSSKDQSGPVLFDIFIVPKDDVYYFDITNTGDRSFLASMMFAEDPQSSSAFSDPNSPFMKTLMPLAISGFVLIMGIIVVIAGSVITIVDWKNEKKSQYY